MYETRNTLITNRTGVNGISNETKTQESTSPTNKNALMKLKSYLIALRVWSLSASIIPTILGEFFDDETVKCATSEGARAKEFQYHSLF